MSANLLAEGDRRDGADGTTYADGVWSIPANGTSKDKNAAYDWPTGTEAVTENQTLHVGLSVRAASGASVVVAPGVAYVDGAGNVNYVATRVSARGTGAWQRVEGSFVIPSGMRVSFLFVHQGAGGAALKLTAPCLSYGSPVCLASSAHTPYATQDHLRSEYATKASLEVTDGKVTAEVTERGKLAGRVGTLESTSGTHASKLEQLSDSITSLVKGESTYTDPDGASATSGIYSLVTQTRDAVTALFGSYTKTADLASTQAVKDAKKAGTDAQAAASAAQTTADSAKSTASAAQSTANTAKTNAATAQSTANAAKGTADSLATMIREDATGITVGKSADGKTYATGRTRMTDSAFQVLDKAGATVAQLAGDGVSFLSGLVRIVVGTGTLPGNKTANFIRVDVGSGVAGLSGIISRLDAAINGFTSSVSAGWEQDFGYGVTAIVRESETVSSAAHLAPDKAELHVGDNHVTMTGGSFDISHPEYLLATLMDTSKVPENLDTCGPGVFSYDTSTASRPTSYGTCVCIRAGGGNWLFQVALPTAGDPLWRRNINGGGWTSWWNITSQ